MRCIAATTALLLFATATNALAPRAAASMAKSKTQKKKRATHKKKAPPKLAPARTIKEPKRFADFVELDDAAFEKRVEAFMRDTTTFRHHLDQAPLTKYPPVRDFEEGQEYVILRDILDEDSGRKTMKVVVYRKSYAGMSELEQRHALLDAFEQS